ncbi:MAG TPA: hypothetical protein VFZ53_27230 [Polyangiaceae bacterium]
MSKPSNPVWAELVQLVPVITLALPFIVKGEVELARAASGFLVGAVSFVLVSGLVLHRRAVLNPILVGTGVWLVLGALAFNVPVDVLASSFVTTQGFSLFIVIGVVGLVATFASPEGFIGARSDDAAWVRRSSFVLLVLAVAAAAWAFRFRSDIRLGGGVPFIVLNVVRRVVIRRAS